MNQVGIGLSYRPASLCSLATQFQTRFLELIHHPIAGLKFPTQESIPRNRFRQAGIRFLGFLKGPEIRALFKCLMTTPTLVFSFNFPRAACRHIADGGKAAYVSTTSNWDFSTDLCIFYNLLDVEKYLNDSTPPPLPPYTVTALFYYKQNAFTFFAIPAQRSLFISYKA